MDSDELRQLISQPHESAKLDFKIKLYKVDEPKPVAIADHKKWEDDQDKQWGEFVKDILAIANGNTGTAQETGYLIIGVGDKFKSDGTRDLCDVGDITPTRTELLRKVNSFCDPRIPDICCETVPLDGKRLFVVSIPPSPYLHRLSKQLKTPKKEYSLHTVLVRRKDGEETYEASPKEQEEIEKEKQGVNLPKKSWEKYENIPLSGVVEFVGREQELEKLHQLLQKPDGLAIVAIIGMGGLGKTELANQYARLHLQSLANGSGDVCWIDGREEDVGIQLVSFARSVLNLNPPEDFDLQSQLRFCWRNWSLGDRLIIIDDVTDYRKQVKPYLPPETSRFKVLLTTREELGRPVENLPLYELQPEAALDLLKSLVGGERIQQELDIAEQLCDWLGYLPLGLELVGRYLERDQDLSLKSMLSLLEKKRLRHKAILEADPTMTARLGVAAAFDLSWERLDKYAQELGCLLSLFALADIPWDLVKLAYGNLPSSEDGEINLYILEEARGELLRFNLLQRTGEGTYRLHPLIREFLREKLEQSTQVDDLKRAFVAVIVIVAKQVPESPTRQQIQAVTLAMPHVAEVAKDKDLRNCLTNENLVMPFIGLDRFYKGQGLYDKAEPWLEQCLSVTQARFGSEHFAVATSLNNLASLYTYQGRYREAEPLYLQALELIKRLLREDNPAVAASLNSLAFLYYSQGRYREAEPLYLQALELTKRLLGEDHPHVARSLNNLASLYDSQGRYSEAEPLYLQALELNKRLQGEDHPHVARSLNNLAYLYYLQGRYSEAEPLYLQALELTKRLLGEDHPHVARSLNNLASLYYSQGRYSEAEPLYLQALELNKRLLGEDHPRVAASLNNLANLYDSQGRYSESEPLYLQALELNKRLLGEDHPDVAISLNNLAYLYDSQGRYSESEPLLAQALEIFQRRLGSNHPNTVNCRKVLASVRDRLNSKAGNLVKSKQKTKKGGSKKKGKGFMTEYKRLNEEN